MTKMEKNVFKQVPSWSIGIIVIVLLGLGFFVRKNLYDEKKSEFKFEEPVKIKRSLIVAATPDNKRNDQSSIIRLKDGRLLIVYSHFGNGSGDHDRSSIYFQTSADDGDTWSVKKEFISAISQGSYIPSLYKKENGNVLVVFSVKESTEPNKTSIRQIEFSPDLTSIITKEHVLVSGGYFPTGSDRLYFDEVNKKLLMPYQMLVKGPGWSIRSLYHTKILVSDDFGNNWIDSGITIEGFLDEEGLGGAMEPGIFKNKDKLIVYSRNLIGEIGACDIVWNGSEYSKVKEYKIKIAVKNAMSSIKYVALLRGWIATYTRLGETDTPTSYLRNQIDVSFSSNGVDWNKKFTVDDVDQVGGVMVNEPNIYVEDEQVFISYTITGYADDTYDLKLLKLPLTVF